MNLDRFDFSFHECAIAHLKRTVDHFKAKFILACDHKGINDLKPITRITNSMFKNGI